jgi:hypothetical protein
MMLGAGTQPCAACFVLSCFGFSGNPGHMIANSGTKSEDIVLNPSPVRLTQNGGRGLYTNEECVGEIREPRQSQVGT